MKKVGIKILSNAGYGADQVKGIKLGELKEFIEEMIEYYGEDTEVITVDSGNKYGAKYGKIYLVDSLDEDNEENDEGDEW